MGSEILWRVVAFDIVAISCGSVWRCLDLCRLFGGPNVSCAVVAAVLYVITLREGRYHGCASLNLADAVEDDLRTAVVGLDGTSDFNGATRQSADVAYVFKVVGED